MEEAPLDSAKKIRRRNHEEESHSNSSDLKESESEETRASSDRRTFMLANSTADIAPRPAFMLSEAEASELLEESGGQEVIVGYETQYRLEDGRLTLKDIGAVATWLHPKKNSQGQITGFEKKRKKLS